MIRNFSSKCAKDVFDGMNSKNARKLPVGLHNKAQILLDQLNAATRVETLKIPPGNCLEKLSGNLRSFWSLRINIQWRTIFRWENGEVLDVDIVDYHKQEIKVLPKKRPPTHPGQMLLHEFLEPLGLTQKEFAEHVGWTYARVNEIIHGKRGVTAESALILADAFDMEAEFWLNLQKNWELWHALQDHKRIGSLIDKPA